MRQNVKPSGAIGRVKTGASIGGLNMMQIMSRRTMPVVGHRKGDSMSATVIMAPNPLPDGKCDLFLSGSIDMGIAQTWRSGLVDILYDLPIVIANPRRDDWDSTWVQSINCKPFREQVFWELNAMERAKVIAVYFTPDSKAPITLLELGLFAHSGRVMVCCPSGFYRKGNIEIVSYKYGIPFYPSLDGLVKGIKQRLKMQ
jgi:hypothetical protein